jgi:hypothetical protein
MNHPISSKYSQTRIPYYLIKKNIGNKVVPTHIKIEYVETITKDHIYQRVYNPQAGLASSNYIMGILFLKLDFRFIFFGGTSPVEKGYTFSMK